MQSIPNGPRQGAVRREWHVPFTRTATQHWPIWGAPFGPVRKRLSALLCSFELALASPAVARLAANRFLTGCILRYLIEGVLVLEEH